MNALRRLAKAFHLYPHHLQDAPPVPTGISLGHVDRVLVESYANALTAQLGSNALFSAFVVERASQFAALPWYRRRAILARQRLRRSMVGRAARRVLEAWDVLLHGLPESDW